jgi:hypothetical protein
VFGFIDHFYTRLEPTSTHSAVANIHTLQITAAPSKPFSSLLGLHRPFLGNGFKQWRFFSTAPSGSIFTASRTELNSQLADSQADGYFTPTS